MEQIEQKMALEVGKIKTPSEVSVNELCICTGTLGRVELETVAACIVLYHWEHSPSLWIPVTRRQIAEWIPTSSALAKVVSNPFWKVDIQGFIEQGFIDGWSRGGVEGADDPGTVTIKFLEMVSSPKTTVTSPMLKTDVLEIECDWETDGET